MLTTKKMLIGLSVLIGVIAAIVLAAPMTTTTCAAAPCKESANGHGTLVMPNGTRRQFSFNAQKQADGTAKGNAVIHNPAFPPDPQFRGNIEIKCLEVVGNRARVAGVVRNTNDPNLDNNTAVFEVVDNGNPGRDNDTISLVFFSPPNSPPPTPLYCQTFENFPQMPIDNGNIKVDDCP
ncbi:MAG: hypothetical protein ACR2HG_10495 [Pyrinomonadaceae bacterium]